MSTKPKNRKPSQIAQRHVSQTKAGESLAAVDEGPMLPSPAEALRLIEEIERIRGSRVITFFAYPDVLAQGDVPLQIHTQLRKIGRVPHIDLYLHSTGGESAVPWRVITLIRNFCEQFSVLIPHMALSAATTLAMGANEIVMGDMSELGPVDPVRTHPLLPKEDDHPMFISVQDLRHCIEFVKNNSGTCTPESMAIIYTALFEKVHPLAVGAIEESYALAKLLSKRALETHMNPQTDREKINTIVNAFSDEFFSHNYRIGWREAQALGLPVTYDSGQLWETMWSLYQHYATFEAVARQVGDIPPSFARTIVWIDSTAERRILDQKWEQTKEAKKFRNNWRTVQWSSDEQNGPAVSEERSEPEEQE